jgi:uncharacterized protein
MSDLWGNRNPNAAQPQSMAVGGERAVAYDEGLRSFMLSVYNYMASGLAITGLVALLVSQSEAAMSLFYHVENGRLVGMAPLGWLVAFAPLGVAMFLGFRLHAMSFQAAQMSFWGFAVLMGLSMANIFLIFTGASIARVFFITAGVFAAMSLYGYTTKRDLTSMGSFLIMGVFGLIIASIVNIWLKSPALYYVLSIIGVFLFIGLTAYDTQRLKGVYYSLANNAEMLAKAGIMGALSLYLDFINLFVSLLQLFGERR